MLLGTMTTFGKTNTNSHNPSRVQTVRKECNLRHIHNRNCGKTVVISRPCPVMDKQLRRHIVKGNHRYDRRGVCSKCHLTVSEVHRYEHQLGLCNPIPYGRQRRWFSCLVVYLFAFVMESNTINQTTRQPNNKQPDKVESVIIWVKAGSDDYHLKKSSPPPGIAHEIYATPGFFVCCHRALFPESCDNDFTSSVI